MDVRSHGSAEVSRVTAACRTRGVARTGAEGGRRTSGYERCKVVVKRSSSHFLLPPGSRSQKSERTPAAPRVQDNDRRCVKHAIISASPNIGSTSRAPLVSRLPPSRPQRSDTAPPTETVDAAASASCALREAATAAAFGAAEADAAATDS